MEHQNGDKLTNERNFRGNVFVSGREGSADPRPSQELIGKAIISMSDGRKIGSVADIVIDRETLQIAALVTSKGHLFNRRVEAIPASEIEIWGQDVVLVTGSEVIQPEEEFSGRHNWLYVADSIKGRFVVSVDGTRVGQVNDVVVDRQGRVVGYELNQVFIDGPISESMRIPSSATHSLGKDVLVVNTLKGLSEQA
jgi:uncharacterized protein YrrD